MAGALALGAVFLIAVVEMVFSPGKGCAISQQKVEESVGRKGSEGLDQQVVARSSPRDVESRRMIAPFFCENTTSEVPQICWIN